MMMADLSQYRPRPLRSDIPTRDCTGLPCNQYAFVYRIGIIPTNCICVRKYPIESVRIVQVNDLASSCDRSDLKWASLRPTIDNNNKNNDVGDAWGPVTASNSGLSRGGKGGSFPGPRDVWGAPPSLKNTENGVPENDVFF